MTRSDQLMTACMCFGDGSHAFGHGFGATGVVIGELCFNTAMTGYQEILTDPSYAGQIVTFTFPHIGIVGANPDDQESRQAVATGLVLRTLPQAGSNWRAVTDFSAWLADQGLIGIAGIDTRRLTAMIRDRSAPHAAIAHSAEGHFDLDRLAGQVRAHGGLQGADLASEVSCQSGFDWSEGSWYWPDGHASRQPCHLRVAALDFGAKTNILRCLADAGAQVRVFPASATAEEILAWEPHGVFLSNGPGDPAATGTVVLPTIKSLLAVTSLPIFGICLGHQLLALALGGRTSKMSHGHHGANHPVKDLETGQVEITSMNHGFTVDTDSMSGAVIETHISLFDGSNCGLRLADQPVFSVQFHPEASPGPKDSHYLFDRFASAMMTYRSPESASHRPSRQVAMGKP